MKRSKRAREKEKEQKIQIEYARERLVAAGRGDARIVDVTPPSVIRDRIEFPANRPGPRSRLAQVHHVTAGT